jgi:hypothetical protein
MSLELRWFFQGKVPEEIERWFNNDFPYGKSSTFEKYSKEVEIFKDIYLFNPEVNYSSVKFRKNCVIIKWRNNSFPISIRTKNMNISGRVEEWVSLKFEEYKNPEKIRQYLDENSDHLLIKINKNRQRYDFKMSVAQNNTIELLKPESDKSKNDCSIELSTAVLEKNNNISWWSLGMDLSAKYGNKDQHLSNDAKHMVETISKTFFKNYPQNNLIEVRSYGYPQLFSMYRDLIKSSI